MTKDIDWDFAMHLVSFSSLPTYIRQGPYSIIIFDHAYIVDILSLKCWYSFVKSITRPFVI